MLFRTDSEHPIHEYLQTGVRIVSVSCKLLIYLMQGPLRYTDMRIQGGDWFFDCHAVIVLPMYLLSDAILTCQNRINVLVPDISKATVRNYLTFCYTGR